MTQPDPDPTNREQILDEWQKAVDAAGGGGNTLDLLQALMAAGYQIVPKVALAAAQAIVDAAVEIGKEGYVDSMLNVPSWRRLSDALDEYLWRTDDTAAALQALDKENG